ncbi:unnamed protein product [Closterium sp. Yama58-4]|nr:unnamed protein product [Closterium sp. Yama58-4]
MDFAMLGPAGEGLQKAGVLLQEGGEFNPAMFRMRLPAVEEGTQVKVRVSYVETMGVRAGYYEVVVPLVVPEAVVPSHLELVEVVQVSCAINSGHTRPLKVGDFNHPMKVMFVELGRASFTGFPASTTPDGKPCVWPNADFVLSYQVVCEDVAAAMLVQAPYEEDPDTRAIFCLSVCPPDPCQLPVYGRAVVFILDSHNAMRGRAMEEARRAVMAALKRLSPADSFGIIAFDYELLVFAEAMESATAEAVKKASKFVLQAYDTDEACNILSPLQLALKMLKGVRGMLPQIVLLSDAAVEDERSICCYLQEALLEWGPNAPRIFTCGIGPSCSYYFLRWIAGVSRGATEFAFTADEVRKKVERLLLAVSRPLITNITIRDMPAGFQLVPFPIPDLYAACPVAVSGRLDGDVPLALELRGVRANGAPWKAKVPVVEAATLPLSTVGIREHTDLMTADAWLQRDPDLERGVARMSQTVCVPSHFTRMVLFETNRANYDALQHDRIQGKDLKVRTYTDPPSAPVSIVPSLVIGLGGPAVAQKQTSQQQQEQQQRGPGGLLGEVLEEDEEEEEGELLQSRQGKPLGLLGSIMSCYRPNAAPGRPHRVTTAAATRLVQLPGFRQRGGLRPCSRRNGAQWRRERPRRVAMAAADGEEADGGGESAEAEEFSPALASGAEAGKGEGSNSISSGSESEGGGDAESREWEGDLQYMMSWQWDDVVRFWRASGASEDQITSEEFESLREWWSTSARYWQRDGRLDGKTLWDVVELLRRWELDGWFRVFETAMSPEMEFALESVVEGKEETFVGEEWMDRLTPRGIREANERRLTGGDTGARGLLGAGDAGVVDVGGEVAVVDGEGEGEVEVSEEERRGVEQRWREMMEESMVRVLQGQTTMPNGTGGAAAAAAAGGESGENGESSTGGSSGSTRRARSSKWVGPRPGDLPSLTHRPPRDWPPPGWQVDADELAVIHGATRGKQGGGRGGEAGAEEEEEERVREERWAVFMKQYEAWVQANKDLLDEEAAVADPIYFPGRRKAGDKYRPGLYELPFVEAGQVYAGQVTTINLNEGCFIDIGAVHDGWVPIYNDDWYELRQVLSIGTPVLVEVTAKRDPFRFRFPIELRLLNPDVDHMIFRRQRYPPHAPIFSRDGDFNLNELAVEVRRPKLPFVKRAFFPNRWERLFVEESEQQEEDFRHPYIQHVDRIQGAERMLVQRVRRGEVVTPQDVALMLPEPADAELVDLAAAEEELKWDEEAAAAAARGEVVDAPPSRHDVLRASLAAVHQQRLQAEQDAVTRDRAARTEVGLPIYEPGREKLVRQIGGGKEEWWRYMSFLYTAVDLALFPNGIPDETAARQAADEALIEAVVGSAAPSSSSPPSAAPSAGSSGSDGGAGDL